MQEEVLFVGYGTNLEPKIVTEIIGGTPRVIGEVGGAFIQDVQLCIQRLENIPDEVMPTAPESISPREYWQEHGEALISSHMWFVQLTEAK